MSRLDIVAYRPEFREQVIDLALKVWGPIFPMTRDEVPLFVYDAFYPHGWEARQSQDVACLLDDETNSVWLGIQDNKLVGFVGIRIHREDQMGEIHIVAVSPDRQRQGIGRNLLEFAEQKIRASGMKIVLVETIDDSGHEPARRAYESFGYIRWPVARYFKPL